MSDILTVRQLTETLRRTIEGSLPFVWVRGEVTNLSRPSSGHVYFSLKDADALLNCVWFRGQQRDAEHFDPLTGEVFEDGPRLSLAHSLANGQRVLCAGRVTVYAPRGSYQLIVELAQDAGLGELHAAFEKLKLKLAGRGFFAQARKRPLPFNPARVAVVTASTGAAIQDFLRIAGERGCGASIRIYPALVQGAGAAEDIIRAMGQAQSDDWAQVLVLIRGGGSLEDLWAFNEEPVAEAVFNASLPVLAGIGHEIDVSMADMTADLRAATPSHAAQLLWPARAELAQRVDDLDLTLQRGALRHIEMVAAQLRTAERALHWLSPARTLQRLEERLLSCVERQRRAGEHFLDASATALTRCEGRLKAVLSMEALSLRLERFEALHRRLNESAKILPREGTACLAGLEQRCNQAGERYLGTLEDTLERAGIRLAASNPLAPLERGYALLREAGGAVVRGVGQVAPGTALRITLRDGKVAATVTKILEEHPHED